ncbi:MAG: AAA family ATPase, partial [bacterium]|nr:AAA family ATPase [bacterium]
MVTEITGRFDSHQESHVEITQGQETVVFGEFPLKVIPGGKIRSILTRKLYEGKTTQRYLKGIAQAIHYGERVLLVGPTGGGKTAMVKHLAQRVGAHLEIIDLDGQTDTAQLVGHFAPADSGKKTFEWIPGVLIKAMQEGWWILLDEINLAEPEIIERINSILDDDQFLIISEHENEEVRVHPNFRLFAAMNPSMYAGRKVLSLAMLNKFSQLWINEDLEEQEERQITTHFLEEREWDLQAAYSELSVPLEVHRRAQKSYGRGIIAKVQVTVEEAGRISFHLQEGRLYERWEDRLRSQVLRLTQSARGPPDILDRLRHFTMVITTEISEHLLMANPEGLPFVAASQIFAKTGVFHPFYFELDSVLQDKIFDHEFISHIALGIYDENAAMEHTKSALAY